MPCPARSCAKRRSISSSSGDFVALSSSSGAVHSFFAPVSPTVPVGGGEGTEVGAAGAGGALGGPAFGPRARGVGGGRGGPGVGRGPGGGGAGLRRGQGGGWRPAEDKTWRGGCAAPASRLAQVFIVNGRVRGLLTSLSRRHRDIDHRARL